MGAAAAVCYLTAKPAAPSGKPSGTGTGSTTGSNGGVALYETSKAVNEYLQFHFGADNDILPYSHGPKVRNDDLPFRPSAWTSPRLQPEQLCR